MRPRRCAFNRVPSTARLQWCALDHTPSAVRPRLRALSHVPLTVRLQWASTMHPQPSVLDGAPSPMHPQPHTFGHNPSGNLFNNSLGNLDNQLDNHHSSPGGCNTKRSTTETRPVGRVLTSTCTCLAGTGLYCRPDTSGTVPGQYPDPLHGYGYVSGTGMGRGGRYPRYTRALP